MKPTIGEIEKAVQAYWKDTVKREDSKTVLKNRAIKMTTYIQGLRGEVPQWLRPYMK